MKSRLLLFAFTLAALWASAQSNSLKTHSIYGELLGPSNGLGIGYEYRFSNDKMWGLRTGFGWTYSESSFFDIGSSLRGYDIPIEINRLFGKKRNHLEIGAGASLGLYNLHSTLLSAEEGAEGEIIFSPVFAKENRFGYFIYGNIGYRHESKRGFQFRVGISPSFNFGDSHGVSKDVIYPYMSFGKTF